MEETLAASLPGMRAARAARSAGYATEANVRTLVVGSGSRAATVLRCLQHEPRRAVVGIVDSGRQPTVEFEFPGVRWLGGIEQLQSVVIEEAVDEVVVALPLRSGFDQWARAVQTGVELGIPVSCHVDLVSGPCRVEFAASGEARLLRCNVHPSTRGSARVLKRAIDVVLAALGVIALSPVLLAAALLVKLSSRGPVLFRQLRMGRARRPFEMLKFRTMVVNAEELRKEVASLNTAEGIIFKVRNDPRVTRIGHILRRTSIDELPQLFNVLRGDMSLVGPRPIPMWVFEQVDEPAFHRRFSVMPGMTGLWQVHGRPQHYSVMARQDLRYVDEWSLWLDVQILARTIPVVLMGGGAD